jgi:hypothetical protein
MMFSGSHCLPGMSLRGCAGHHAARWWAFFAASLPCHGACSPAHAVSRSPISMKGVCERAMATPAEERGTGMSAQQ